MAIFSTPRRVENETAVEFFGPAEKDSLIFLNERNILNNKNDSDHSSLRLEENLRNSVGF